MQDTEEIIFKSLDILGKLMDADESSRRQEKKEPPAEEPDMVGGGGEPPQEQLTEQQVEHDPGEHFSLNHIHTQVLIGTAITAVGIVLAAYFGMKARKSKG